LFFDFDTLQFKQYRTEIKDNLPPNLDAGTTLGKIERIEQNNFKLNDKDTKGMRVFADGKEYRTSSGVIMSQLEEFFKTHPNETLDNVRVVAPRGKKYLTLEEV
jgi:hypothetical protein